MLRFVPSVLFGGALLLAGCEPGSFVPPPPPELVSQSELSPQPLAKSIEMILLTGETPERSIWSHLARLEAGRAKVVLGVSRPKTGDPPARQAELIREAIARGVAALIVEPAEAPEIADALAEAQAKGVAVVLLDRTVPSKGKPYTVVTYKPFTESARLLVDAVIEDAEKEKLSPKGPAILLVNGLADSHTAERVAALKDALEKAGVTVLDPITFDALIANAQKTLLAALAAHPEVDMVLTDEQQGLSAAGNVQTAKEAKGLLIMAGYVTVDDQTHLGEIPGCAGVVDRNLTGFVHASVQAALDLSQGKAVPERIEVTPTFHRTGFNPASSSRTADSRTTPPFDRSRRTNPSPPKKAQGPEEASKADTPR